MMNPSFGPELCGAGNNGGVDGHDGEGARCQGNIANPSSLNMETQGGLGVNSYLTPVSLKLDPRAGKHNGSLDEGGNAGQIVIQYSVPAGTACNW
jgi:hypothetical protein